jgi:hypothetical protein
MDAGRARLVLDIRSGKMELEGSEEFVVGQFDRLAPMLAGSLGEFDAAGASAPREPARGAGEAGAAGGASPAAVVLEPPAGPLHREDPKSGAHGTDANTLLPDSFEAWLERLRLERPGAKDVERVMWAGYHIQLRSRDDAFTAPQVVQLLLRHGITVKYPSQAIHQNYRTGKIVRVTRGRFRLTPETINKLLGKFAA